MVFIQGALVPSEWIIGPEGVKVHRTYRNHLLQACLHMSAQVILTRYSRTSVSDGHALLLILHFTYSRITQAFQMSFDRGRMKKNASARKLESGDASTAGYSHTSVSPMLPRDTHIASHLLPQYRHDEAHNWFTDNWLRDRPRLCVTSDGGRDSFIAVLQERDDRASARALVAIPSPVKCCLCFDRVRMRAFVARYVAS